MKVLVHLGSATDPTTAQHITWIITKLAIFIYYYLLLVSNKLKGKTKS